MADTINTKSVMSLVATSSSRIRDLIIKDGQLIFIQDLGRIAFDFKGQRVFYNQIVEIKVKALGEKISLDELYLILYHYLKHRGISYLEDAEQDSVSGTSSYANGLKINAKELEIKDLLTYTDNVYLGFGAEPHLEGVENRDEIAELQRKAQKEKLSLIDIPLRHLGTEKSQELATKNNTFKSFVP